MSILDQIKEEKNKKDFLAGLAALVKKHKITVSGCGCCGSPFLSDIDNNDYEGGIDNNFKYRIMSDDEAIDKYIEHLAES